MTVIAIAGFTYSAPARDAYLSGVTRNVAGNPRVAGADKTAGSSVLRTALSPAPSTTVGRFAAGWRGGRQTATRTLGVAPESGGEAKCRQLRRALHWYVQKAREWWRRMGAGAGPRRSIAENPCPRYLSHLWRQKAIAARHAFERWFTRTYEKWRCIHEHEGAWDSNTGNGYNGGLQMTPWFQATYGAEFLRRLGPAHLWPIWAQLVAAERAYATTGFRQWPNTARMCGLL